MTFHNWINTRPKQDKDDKTWTVQHRHHFRSGRKTSRDEDLERVSIFSESKQTDRKVAEYKWMFSQLNDEKNRLMPLPMSSLREILKRYLYTINLIAFSGSWPLSRLWTAKQSCLLLSVYDPLYSLTGTRSPVCKCNNTRDLEWVRISVWLLKVRPTIETL